ncbi:hypothetical protein RZN32_24015, partial [Klebsiella pneumoniae]|nr:hypothetical protein [Klebsiella pneumoniae]
GGGGGGFSENIFCSVLFFFGFLVVQLPEVITLQAGRCIFTILSLYVWHRNNGSFTNMWDRPLLRKK